MDTTARAAGAISVTALAGMVVASRRAAIMLLRPERTRPRSDGVPTRLPFAYNWPTHHPMSVVGPWPEVPGAMPADLNAGEEILGIGGTSATWSNWQAMHRELRVRGPGAPVILRVRQPDGPERWVSVDLIDDPSTPRDLGAEFADVEYFARSGVTVRAWYLSAGLPGSPTVIAVHGMAASRRAMLAPAVLLQRAGYNVLVPDAVGHGESDGLNVDLVGRDEVIAGLDWLERCTDGDPAAVAAMGHSYGGIKVLMAAAHDTRIRTIVAYASPLTIAQGVRSFASGFLGLPSWLIEAALPFMSAWVRYLTCDWLRDGDGLTAACHIAQPTLVIQGSMDELWPAETARTLYNALMGPKELVMVPGVDHNALLVADVFPTVRRFLDRHVRARSTSPGT